MTAQGGLKVQVSYAGGMAAARVDKRRTSEMRDDGYEACGTERVDMRKRIIARMVSSPGYMAAIPLTVADLRAEGDDEGADELSRLAAEAQRRIDAKSEPGLVRRAAGGSQAQLPTRA